MLSTLVAVALAEAVDARIDPRRTRRLAGALLIVMGGIYRFGAIRPAAR
ncbi:hypothetical protein [Sorangium sp. So ce385]